MSAFGLSAETWSAIGTIAAVAGSIVTAFGTVATAWGVWYARVSLRRSEDQARTNFEDGLWHEYRSIIQNLPVGALLGEEMTDEAIEAHLRWFYLYFDLTNSQIFLRLKGRVRKETWVEWLGGIQDNFRQPAFRRAWGRVRPNAVANSTLAELRRLEDMEFSGDPKDWSL